MGNTEETGDSRTGEVLDPAFIDQLESLSIEEVRRRRDLALAEREYQSYLRRLVQVRIDLLTSEQTRRQTEGEAPPLVDRIASALAEGPQGRGRGEALRLKPPDDDIAEAERRADEAMGGVFGASFDAMNDEALREKVARLRAAEQEISTDRSAVLRVHDALQAELKRRYREDLSQVPVDL